jgi:hypothetical protein
MKFTNMESRIRGNGQPVEFRVGTEDVVFQNEDMQWFWQCRGTNESVGPFRTRNEAYADYKKLDR